MRFSDVITSIERKKIKHAMHGIDSVKAVLQGKMIKLNVLKINLKLNSNVAELNESTLKLKQLL